MMQRYTVFLNDRAVIIGQDIDIPYAGTDEMLIEFTDKTALLEAYKRFCADLNCVNLKINAGKNFAEACIAFNSLFTRIEAAGGLVRNQQGEYLFIKRFGLWDLPKGKLYKKERVQIGAVREVMEETGLSGLTIIRQLPSTYHIYTDRRGAGILKETFWFEMSCGEEQKLVPQLEEDITEVKWFTDTELQFPIQNTYASLRALLLDYLQM